LTNNDNKGKLLNCSLKNKNDQGGKITMKIGALSDTHNCSKEAIEKVMAEFKKSNVEIIVHCGDIEPHHLKKELFDNLHTVVALTKDQINQPAFNQFNKPEKWHYTAPENRVVSIDLNGECIKIYVGHQRSFEFLTGSEEILLNHLEEMRKTHDGIRLCFSGHTHYQTCAQMLNSVIFINPGAVITTVDGGIEFAIIDTVKSEISFRRIPTEKPIKKPTSIAVISDTVGISEIKPTFWQRLAKDLAKRQISKLIWFGNLRIEDIHRPELKDIEIYFRLKPNQLVDSAFEEINHLNWHPIRIDDSHLDYSIISIDGYEICIKPDLGIELAKSSERDINQICKFMKVRHPYLEIILFGNNLQGFYEGGTELPIVSPGDAKLENLAILNFPSKEITLSHVPH